MSVFSFGADLPAGVLRGVVREDIGASREGAPGSQWFAGGAPAVGQRIAIELQLDAAALTWMPGNAPSSWMIVTGTIQRVSLAEDAQLGNDAMVVVDAVVTTESAPQELDASFKVLLEREGSEWSVKQLVHGG